MSFKEIKSQFTFGHVSAIAIAFLFVGGLLVSQNWNSVKNVFADNDAQANEQQEGSGLYYAYEAPTTPTVLGADTIGEGPAVINEDGTVSGLSSFGAVLGAASDSPEVNLDAIRVNTFSATETDLRNYIDDSFLVEAKVLPGDFETALVSNDATQTQEQIQKLQQVENDLSSMRVPNMAEKLHKLKIAQYQTAIELLKNYYQIDSNPGFVSEKLTQFMDMQKKQETETQNLFKQYPQL